jgi:hypothetical protein
MDLRSAGYRQFLGMAGVACLSLTCLLGCAEKKQRHITATPGVHHYRGCKEVSIDVKNNTVTVICPLLEEK